MAYLAIPNVMHGILGMAGTMHDDYHSKIVNIIPVAERQLQLTLRQTHRAMLESAPQSPDLLVNVVVPEELPNYYVYRNGVARNRTDEASEWRRRVKQCQTLA